MKRRLGGFGVAVALATAFVLVFVRPSQEAVSTSEPTRTDVQDLTPRTTTNTDTSTGGSAPTDDAVETGGANLSDSSLDSSSSLTIAHDAPSPPHGALLVEVTRLADGDSFDISWIDPKPEGVWRNEVRMLGINAPERHACFGPEARGVLAGLIGDDPLMISIASSERDDYGRAIANVWNSDGVLLNVAVVEQGAALSLSDSTGHRDLIERAQAAAKAEGRGLWSACDADADVIIADLVADAPGRDNENPNGEWIEIANVGSSRVDLTGWGIRDESTRHRFLFPDGFFLEPGRVVRIGSGCEFHPASSEIDLFWCASDPLWNNGGDTAYLVDPEGHFADEWSY